MKKSELAAAIRARKKSFLTWSELQELAGSRAEGYAAFAALTAELCADGVLKPSGTAKNGMLPPLSQRYRILRQIERGGDDLREEIRHLSPQLKLSFYLEHPEAYRKHRDTLLPLSQFLKERAEELKSPMSKNERAYQIWGYEKYLDSSAVQTALAEAGADQLLNYYLTPEPFFDFLTGREGAILIIENKDTWFTLRRLLARAPERDTIFGLKLGGLLLGEGNKVTKSGAVEEYRRDMLNRDAVFYYIGDLDFAGVDMYLRVKRENPKTEIHAFQAFYSEMLRRYDWGQARRIETNQNRNVGLEEFYREFPAEERLLLRRLFSEDRYIPQEIISCPILQELLTGKEEKR